MAFCAFKIFRDNIWKMTPKIWNFPYVSSLFFLKASLNLMIIIQRFLQTEGKFKLYLKLAEMTNYLLSFGEIESSGQESISLSSSILLSLESFVSFLSLPLVELTLSDWCMIQYNLFESIRVEDKLVLKVSYFSIY